MVSDPSLINNQKIGSESPSTFFKNQDFPEKPIKPSRIKLFIILTIIILIVIFLVYYFCYYKKTSVPVRFSERGLTDLQGLDTVQKTEGLCISSYLVHLGGRENEKPFYSIEILLKSDFSSEVDLIKQLSTQECQKENQDIINTIISKFNLKSFENETALISYTNKKGQRFILP